MEVSWVTVAVGEKAHAIVTVPFWKKTLCGYWIRRWYVTTADDNNPRCRKCERSAQAAERQGE